MLCMHNKVIWGIACVIEMSVFSHCASPRRASYVPRSATSTRIEVQLYAENVSDQWPTEIVEVYLILPDGSRAVGNCLIMMTDTKRRCHLEPFTPEKRISIPCAMGKSQASCISNEKYYADRTGNDITVYGQNGPATYQITGSWTEFHRIE